MMYTYMALSIIAVIFLSLSTDNLVKNYKEYKNQQSSIKHWNVSKDTYKTEILDLGQIKNEELAKKFNSNLKNYYNSSYNKGFIIDTGNFYNSDGRPLYKLNEKENTNIEPDGKTITVDKNYLKEHRIKTNNNKDILNCIVHSDNTQNIIVPIKYKKYGEIIEDNFKDNFTFRKDIEHYKNKTNKNLKINIIWTNNQVSYHTYDNEIGGKKNIIVAPIAIIESGNTDPLNFGTYFSTSYFFKSQLDNPYMTIRKGLEKYNIDGYIPSVMSVYDTKVDEVNNLKVNTLKYTLLAFMTGITFIMMTFTFIRLYFTSYQYLIFIKRNLGYSYFQIHKSILAFLLFINLLMAILILIQQNIISYFIFISIILIEIIIFYYSFIKLNKENTNEVLKGKKMIKLKNIHKSYDNKNIIKNFNYSINKGDFVIIKGASGTGKSSLLNIFGLLESPDIGEVTFNETPIHNEKNKRLFRQKDIAYIYQNYGLLENESILKNLTLPLNISKKDINKIERVTNQLGISHIPLKTKVYTCSGGEQQRISIARAILKEPSLIIADEPTGNLDKANAFNIMDIFEELNKKGITIIMATHDHKFFDIGNKQIDLNFKSTD